MNASHDKKQFQANDIKYRALKITRDEALLELLYETDSLYNLDSEKMRRWILQQEDQLSEQARILQLAGEKKKEAKELKKKVENK